MIWNESDGRVYYVRRRVSKDFLPEYVNQMAKSGAGNVVMWSCIMCDGVGPLVKVEGRRNSDDYIFIVIIESVGIDNIFMDDNAPCHWSEDP